MAYTLDDFPISTDEPRIEVNLPVGTHILELVVEDSAGLRSLPDTVVITVEPEEVTSATISAIEPAAGFRGAKVNLTISGTGLSEATGVVFYTRLTPTLPTTPTVRPTITLPVTRPTLPEMPLRPVNIPDSTLTAVITERSAEGIGVAVTIDGASTTGARTFGVITPRGTVQSGALTFTVRTLPTITRPTVTIPTITRPTVTIPTITRPTATIPTITRPTVTIPTITRPTVTIPTITRPTATIPTITRPTVTIPTITRPTATIPTITRPTVTIPTITRPTVTIPTIPHFEDAPALSSVRGVGSAIETKLKAAGITSVNALASTSAQDLAVILGYRDPARAEALIAEAVKLLGRG